MFGDPIVFQVVVVLPPLQSAIRPVLVSPSVEGLHVLERVLQKESASVLQAQTRLELRRIILYCQFLSLARSAVLLSEDSVENATSVEEDRCKWREEQNRGVRSIWDCLDEALDPLFHLKVPADYEVRLIVVH